MSKYIIEIKPEYEDSFKGLMILGAKDSNLFVDTLAVEDLEELNSDYINEHFSDFQDTAYKKGLHDGESKCGYCNEYQRGFEDGKAVNDKGCEGCKHENDSKFEVPCNLCSNNLQSLWTAKDDKIEVGDEVRRKIAPENEKGGIVTKDWENSYFIMWADGSSGQWDKDRVVKTGRHFDIASILEDMRND